MVLSEERGCAEIGKKTHDEAPKQAGKNLSAIHKTDRLKRREINLEERVRPYFFFH